MSFVLFTCLSAGAAVAGWLSGRSARRRYETGPVAERRALDAKPRAWPLEGFPFAVGDVIGRGANDEILVDGAWRLNEGSRRVGVCYFGAARGVERMVTIFSAAPDEAYWLAPHDVRLAPDAPSVVEIDGVLLERVRRLPVEVEAVGSPPAPPAAATLLVEYQAPGHGVWLIFGAEGGRAYRGEVIPLRWVEHWPSGERPAAGGVDSTG